LKNNNVELLNIVNGCYFLDVKETELPSMNYASMGGGGNPSDSGGFNDLPSGYPNPSPNDGSNPGSSNSGGPNADNFMSDEQFNSHKLALREKLADIFINRPPRVNIRMTDPQFEHMFSALDHNIVCKHLLNIRSPLLRDVEYTEYAGIKYRGIISRRFLEEMRREN
jgi:hypothetical protein